MFKEIDAFYVSDREITPGNVLRMDDDQFYQVLFWSPLHRAYALAKVEHSEHFIISVHHDYQKLTFYNREKSTVMATAPLDTKFDLAQCENTFYNALALVAIHMIKTGSLPPEPPETEDCFQQWVVLE
ncbi:MAG: hypothetical protein ACRC2J_17540 [Microcoleaceae cyanobacterium]